MGCGYSRGSSSSYSPPSKPWETSDFVTFGFIMLVITFLFNLVNHIMIQLNPPPKTKITDYYSTEKVDKKSSKGPYKHVED
jgi:hypothetical protein